MTDRSSPRARPPRFGLVSARRVSKMPSGNSRAYAQRPTSRPTSSRLSNAADTVLKRVLTAAGVDHTQWRALLRAYVMIDYAALLGAHGATATNHAVTQLLVTSAAFGVLSVTPALIIWNTTDLLVAGIVL